MFKQTCLAIGSVSLLSACTLFAEFGQESVERPLRNVAEQDPYWKRFYELEQEIAQLRKKLDDGRQAASVDQGIEQLPSSTSLTKSTATQSAEEFLTRLRGQADKAISTIDQAIVALDQKQEAIPQEIMPQEGELVAVQQHTFDREEAQPQVAIAGSISRDSKGEVVQQTTLTQPRQAAYNYSVVYVYPEPQPWNDMWDKLEAANETDKWRGSNPAKPSYFIYVGAYLHQEDAQQRQQSLMAILGEGPELRTNLRNTAIAAK